MKIGRLIERNVFTSIWVLGIILSFLAEWLGVGYEVEPRFPWLGQVFYTIYFRIFYYIFSFVTWPQEILNHFLFDTKEGLFRINIEWITNISLMISLCSFIAIDFLLRELLWNKKQVPEKNIV